MIKGRKLRGTTFVGHNMPRSMRLNAARTFRTTAVSSKIAPKRPSANLRKQPFQPVKPHLFCKGVWRTPLFLRYYCILCADARFVKPKTAYFHNAFAYGFSA